MGTSFSPSHHLLKEKKLINLSRFMLKFRNRSQISLCDEIFTYRRLSMFYLLNFDYCQLPLLHTDWLTPLDNRVQTSTDGSASEQHPTGSKRRLLVRNLLSNFPKKQR